jgi:2-iminobutanoate/2-iminopropanoate deaminase
MTKHVIRTEAAPAPFQGAPYNQAIVANGFVFVAGQIGVDPATGDIVDGGIRAQTEQIFKNLSAILEAAGSSIDNIVKTSVFICQLGDFSQMNEVYAAKIGDTPPARSTFEVGKLPAGAVVEIEAIAVL